MRRAAEASWRRWWVTGLLGFAVILAAGIGLTRSSPTLAQDDSQENTCTAANGAQCSGETCCANATQCHTDTDLCLAMFCADYPEAKIC